MLDGTDGTRAERLTVHPHSVETCATALICVEPRELSPEHTAALAGSESCHIQRESFLSIFTVAGVGPEKQRMKMGHAGKTKEGEK